MGHLGAKSGQILTLSDSQRDAKIGGLINMAQGVDITEMIKVVHRTFCDKDDREEKK